MRVLVIGQGAREHALVARLAADLDVGEIVAAPGNPGIARVARTVSVDVSDVDAVLALADHEQIDLTVVGPELPLSLGLADRFESAGRLIFGLPVVLKADGLAAGKGVVIAEDRAAAERAITDAMRERKFGAAGDRIVIEECLRGPEVSFFLICDGMRAVPIGTAQDHKRVFDDDRGPN